MRYTVYKTTNRLNGKYYIGKHQTEEPNDRYLGSGRAILNAIKAHGRSNFEKEVLFEFDSEAEMNAKEKEMVNEALVADPMSYNMAVGGEGGPHFKGKKHTNETRALLRSRGTGRVVSDETRLKLATNRHTTETKEKISVSAKKRVWSEETKRKISESLKRHRQENPISEETRRQISETMKARRSK